MFESLSEADLGEYMRQSDTGKDSIGFRIGGKLIATSATSQTFK